uniref:Uncharacterized protein n=1 Tax=Hippocampus comes TaxID=109280 RepID=A0A3Q2X948_HIPCM
MDAILSLGAPLKQFTSTCAPGKGGPAPKGAKGRRSSFTRRRSISRRRSLRPIVDTWHSKPAAKKEDSLFGAFQGLSLDGVMGGVNGSAAAAATAAGGDQCSVM